MPDLEDLIADFEDHTEAFGDDHRGEWGVLSAGFKRFVSFREAAEYAIPLAPPYAIRQIGTTTMAAQGSVLYEGPSAVREPKGCTVGAGSLMQEGIAIGVHVGFSREVSWDGPHAGLFEGPSLRAIIDTGGHHSAIDEGLAMSEGLPRINRANVVGATQESVHRISTLLSCTSPATTGLSWSRWWACLLARVSNSYTSAVRS